MTASTEMTTKDFAAAIGTDPKTLRKFLRSTTPVEDHPGKGGRWTLPGTKTVLNKARKDFAKWQKDQADAAADRAAKAVKDAEDAMIEVEGLDEDEVDSDQD
jgi:methionine synthase II (cobalamin-independent)